jgi:predicted ester cyclase
MKKLLMILPLALILCFMVGCQDKAAMEELEEFKAHAAIEEQNMEVVRKWLKAADEGNIEGAMELFAPNFLWYSPSNNPAPMSKEESHEYLVMVLKAFPKWIHKIEEIMAVGDKVITRIIDYTTHEGKFQGIPATGNKLEFSVIVIWTLKDRKIVEMREDADMLGFMTQLGMELKPKEGE